VAEQRRVVETGDHARLLTPAEDTYPVQGEIATRLGIGGGAAEQ
jgi:hypothetical protein